jgi:hypothetical protein
MFIALFRFDYGAPNGATTRTSIFSVGEKGVLGDTVAQFCFPTEATFPLLPGTRFSFCLTGQDATPTYGYVQHRPSSTGMVAYCLMSFFFDPEFFYQVITDYETKCAAQMDGIAFLRGRLKPDLMPMLQENVEHEHQVVKSCVAFAFRTMDVHLLSEILVAVLLSRRILITSDRIDVMERFCFALLAMVYPLAWPGVFIPVLPVTIIATIYAPFQYIIGLHSSMLPHTQAPEMDSYVLVDLDHGKVRHFNQPYKIPSQVQRQITKFGGLVQTVGIGKGFRDFIIRLIGYVVKRDPHDPTALAAAYNAMASAKGDKKDRFEVSILESQFVAQLMKEAEAGRGSEVYEAYWGQSDVFVPPSRPPVPVPAPPLDRRLVGRDQHAGASIQHVLEGHIHRTDPRPEEGGDRFPETASEDPGRPD